MEAYYGGHLLLKRNNNGTSEVNQKYNASAQADVNFSCKECHSGVAKEEQSARP